MSVRPSARAPSRTSHGTTPSRERRSSTRSINTTRNDEIISLASSDPLAMSDNDISPFRPLPQRSASSRAASRKGKAKVLYQSEDEEGNVSSLQGISRSSSSSVLFVAQRDSRNAIAGPSSHAVSTTDDSIFDPALYELNSVSDSDSEFEPRRQTNKSNQVSSSRLRQPSTSSQVSRGTPVVEIPLLPFAKLSRYAIRPGSVRPSQGSRDLLRGLTPNPDSSVASSPGKANHRPGVPRWRVTSSPSYGEDESDDEDELGNYGSDGSDDIVLRRSGRTTRTTAPRERRKDQLVSPRTRSKLHEDESSREASYISSISEEAFYRTQTPKRERGRPPKSMAKRSGKLPKKSAVSSDDFEMSSEGRDESEQDKHDEIDELESESEYEDGTRARTKGKMRSRSAQKARKVDERVLQEHRAFCEKCSREPADVILEKAQARKQKSRGRKRRKDEDELSDEEIEEIAGKLEGWLECTDCVVSSHWGCLIPKQQKDVLNMLAEREGPRPEGIKPRRSVKIDEATIFTCARCEANDKCFVCHQGPAACEDDEIEGTEAPMGTGHRDEPMEVDGGAPIRKSNVKEERDSLMFRCLRCKQIAHYEHLEVPDSLGQNPSLPRIADHYQSRTEDSAAWFCHQCRSWTWTVDLIVAWKPCPADAKETPLEPDEYASWKDSLPREYLVKWAGRGFRHITWASHAWLQVIAPVRLRNFLVKGPSLDLITDASLAAKGDEIAEPTITKILEEDDRVEGGRSGHAHHSQHEINGHGGEDPEWVGGGPGPEPDAKASIPILWSTVDRVLDVMLLPPSSRMKTKPQQRRGQRILSVSETPSGDSRRATPAKVEEPMETKEDPRAKLGLKDGLEPSSEMMVDIEQWEKRTGRQLGPEDMHEVADMVTWCFVKWDDLQYDQSCWDTPPPIDSALYPAFERALERYLRARQVEVPVLTPAQCKKRDHDAERAYVPPQEQPECIVGGKLMPFQLEGVQWLLYNYFKRHSCILADDMGLGKTVQIASFLGYLGSDKHLIYPSLVVVPNSTITNWVREFEKWVPHMQVVPYYGEAASRKIISRYELYHKGLQGKAVGLRAHVVLTTYDMITGAEFRVFGGIPRWEVVCVDEGQRLKSDNSLIFNRLKTLNSIHRILLTGTPLNNNLRELFNLLNFLDPKTFKGLGDLEKRFENLNETLIQELHEMIKPYILRRIKADVLKLPPKVEIIVPISLTPLQKQVYKGIFERNADLIQAIYQSRQKKAKAAIAGGK